MTAGESPAGAAAAPASQTLENEHAVQLRLVEAFRTAAAGGEGRDVAAGILRHLVDFTLMHFLLGAAAHAARAPTRPTSPTCRPTSG